MKCTQRLYLNQDRNAVVAAGHEDAHSLYAVPGDEIPAAAAERFGLVDGHLEGFDPNAELEPVEEPVEEPVKQPETVTATQKLFLTKDRKSVVAEGHDDAGELYADVGDQIPVSAHAEFGLVDGALPGPVPIRDVKEVAPPKDKEQKGAADKEDKSASTKTADPDNGSAESGAVRADVVNGDAKV